jgi:hypothetical protein
VSYADGTTLQTRIAAARGSLGNPMSDAEIEAKLRSLCEYGQSGVQAQRLIEAVWRLESSTDAGALMTHASTAPHAS